ncbi:uncharacterized protein OCT59_024940 [Rhizophagus irregularis]|uniref:uncharacterized protein n=1 Tax=Rhizophagus irregularis TaxID=588596 RepID=UPI003322B8E2|nr:hypothetical protein OCT59_024940 [Rhizophagus irregularis]
MPKIHISKGFGSLELSWAEFRRSMASRAAFRRSRTPKVHGFPDANFEGQDIAGFYFEGQDAARLHFKGPEYRRYLALRNSPGWNFEDQEVEALPFRRFLTLWTQNFEGSRFPFKHFEDDNSKCHLFYFVFNERLLKFVFLFYMETRDLKSKSSKVLDTVSKELNSCLLESNQLEQCSKPLTT